MIRLVISDLHLTSNPIDEYRWNIFPQLQKLIKEHSVDYLYVLGDLTEKKDLHNAKLVTRIVQEFLTLAENCSVFILQGNHDYIDSRYAFFRFLSLIPTVHFVTIPLEIEQEDGSVDLFIPHTKHPVTDWKEKNWVSSIERADRIFMHQSVLGAKLTNDSELKEASLPYEYFTDFKAKAYSGDIHTPHKLGKVEYIGAPYPIYFGDSYTGRVLLLNNKHKETSIKIDSIRKLTITISSTDLITDFEVNPKDQIKVKVRLKKSEYYLWDTLKQNIMDYVKNKDAELISVELETESGAVELTKVPELKPVKAKDFLELYSDNEKLAFHEYEFANNIMRGTCADYLHHN